MMPVIYSITVGTIKHIIISKTSFTFTIFLKNISIVSGKAGITSKKQTGDGRSEICLTSGQYQIHIK